MSPEIAKCPPGRQNHPNWETLDERDLATRSIPCTSSSPLPNMGLLGGSDGKESACNAGDLGSVPGSGRSLEEGMATHTSILAWRIPLIEEPGRLQSICLQRVGQHRVTNMSTFLPNMILGLKKGSRALKMATWGPRPPWTGGLFLCLWARVVGLLGSVVHTKLDRRSFLWNFFFLTH